MKNQLLTFLAAASIFSLQMLGSWTDEPQFQSAPIINPAVHFDVSLPLREIEEPPEPNDQYELEQDYRIPIPRGLIEPDPVAQDQLIGGAAPSLIQNFEGMGRGFTGPNGTFFVGAAPPDPNGDVGPNHYFEMVNSSITVFTKTGIPILGPMRSNSLWKGFGGGCETNNNGDGVVQYDILADRWVISQFSVSTQPYLQCVAVSQTGDPTGSYARYSFQYSNFPDYAKIGVWPDAYYITFNMFGPNSFLGPKA